MRAEDAPTTDVIHPAWLAHPPSEPSTEPIRGRSGGADEDATLGILARPATSEGNEPTHSDQPGDAAGDQPGDERDGPRGQA